MKDFIKNKWQKALVFAGMAMTSVMAFAEGADTSVDADAILGYDNAKITDLFTGVKEQFSGLIEAALPYITAFVVAGLVIWGALALIGIMKRAFGSGRGR